MTESYSRTPQHLDARVLQLEPLTQWWTHDNVVCVALRSVSRTPVVTVGGSLDRRAAIPCRRALEAALRARPRWVLIDLASVTSSDDSCSVLLRAMAKVAAWHGSEVWLAGVPERVRTALDAASALAEFPIARNASRAIEEIRRAQVAATPPRGTRLPTTGPIQRPRSGYSADIQTRTA
jgi:anti-anti-sigma regulatory factor